MVTSINNAVHYKWGNNCDGWHLLQTGSLSVIEEYMPPGTSEQLHYHEKAQQVFYILSGTANFEIDDKKIVLNAGESVHIPSKVKHRVYNETNEGLKFIIISEPRAHGDRINL